MSNYTVIHHGVYDYDDDNNDGDNYKSEDVAISSTLKDAIDFVFSFHVRDIKYHEYNDYYNGYSIYKNGDASCTDGSWPKLFKSILRPSGKVISVDVVNINCEKEFYPLSINNNDNLEVLCFAENKDLALKFANEKREQLIECGEMDDGLLDDDDWDECDSLEYLLDYKSRVEKRIKMIRNGERWGDIREYITELERTNRYIDDAEKKI